MPDRSEPPNDSVVTFCDLCHDRIPQDRDNRKPGECRCFVSADGLEWND